MNSAKPSFTGNQATTALSQQFNTIQHIEGKGADLAVSGFDQAAANDRRAGGQ